MKKMISRKLTIIFTLLLALGLQFCSQPSELSDPVKVTPKDREKVRIRPEIYYISIGENGIETQDYVNIKKEHFETTKIEISVDTLYPTPIIWFKVNIEREGMNENPKEFRRLSLRNINFNIDSFPVMGIPLQLKETDFPKSWVKVKLARGPKKDFDSIIDPSRSPNYFELGFTLNKPFREIWATGYGKIYNTRYSLTKRDTTVVDSVLKTKYDTVWIDGKPYVKKVEYWDVKEIKLQIEEITPFPDSLLLNFKLRLKY
jgi:hypothetical protein